MIIHDKDAHIEFLNRTIGERDDEIRRLRTENAELRLAAQVELAEGDQVLAELEWFKARELKVDRLLNACKRWSNVTTADCLVELHAAVAEFKSANGAKPGAGT